jgi:hypothetical protein
MNHRCALTRRDRRAPQLWSEWRIGFYSSGIAGAYVITAAWIIGRNGLPATTDGVACTDFSWIWLSAKLAASNVSALIYDYSAFSAQHAQSGLPSCTIEHFDYPPTLLLFTYPLGLMPHLTAFAAWIGATLALYLAAVYAIIPRRAAVAAAATPFVVLLNVLLGHNGFLTAGLVGLTLVLIDRQPWVAGIFLGLLTYKPQFGVLFPFALLALREWRALVSATATSVMFGLTAAIAFGFEVWPSFIHALTERALALSRDPTLNAPLVSPLSVLQAWGADPPTAWAAQLAVTAILAAAVYALWRRPLPYPLKASALATAAPLAAPHAIGYDLCILSIAAAFLVKDGLSRGFLIGEGSVLLLCWLGLVVPIGPIPAIICTIVLGLVARRIFGPASTATAGSGSG